MAFAVVVGACKGPAEPPPTAVTVDVVVVGAGTGGTSAALAAARHGARVMVVESSGWVGGQMAGVPALEDTRPTLTSNTGFARELGDELVAYYAASGKSVFTCGLNPALPIVCAEPHVVRDVLQQAMQDAGIELRTHTEVVAVERDGDVVTSVTLSDRTHVAAHVVIDATELGDVLPLAGVEYRVGNQRSSRGIDPAACIQDITQVAPIRKYDVVPAGFALTSEPPGYAAAPFAALVQAGSTTTTFPWSWARHNLYRGVPDSARPGSYDTSTPAAITRTNVNLANDVPATVAYVEDRATRDKVDCEAALATLRFLYYAQHELGLEQGDAWSVSDDEGFAEAAIATRCPDLPAELAALVPYLPPRPYIREGRRIVALHTLTGGELDRGSAVAPRVPVRFHSAIALGWYSMDLHGCASASDLETELGDGAVPAESLGMHAPFAIPFESLIPITVDGVIAAEKNIGVSRLANGATRLQGVTLLVGQAAGTIAALASTGGVQPRDVDPFEVQRALVADGAALAIDALGDVATGDPRWGAIQLAITRGVMAANASGAFSPTASLTRADGAIAVATLFQLTLDPPASPSFGDVDVVHPAFLYVEAMLRAGFTTGCGGGNFCPDAALTRAQLAVFLAKGLEPSPPACTTPPFADVAMSDPTCPAIAYVTARGLLAGCGGGSFCPASPIQRADAAAAFLALMIAIGAP